MRRKAESAPKRFKIVVEATASIEIEVEADDLEEAISIAEDKASGVWSKQQWQDIIRGMARTRLVDRRFRESKTPPE